MANFRRIISQTSDILGYKVTSGLLPWLPVCSSVNQTPGYTLSLTACQAIAFHSLIPQVQRQRSLSCTNEVQSLSKTLSDIHSGYSLLCLLCHKLMLCDINVILLNTHSNHAHCNTPKRLSLHLCQDRGINLDAFLSSVMERLFWAEDCPELCVLVIWSV